MSVIERLRMRSPMGRRVLVWGVVLVGMACTSDPPPPPVHPVAGAHGYVIQDPDDPAHRYRLNVGCERLINRAQASGADSVVRDSARACAYQYDLAVRRVRSEIARSELRRQGRLAMDIPEYHDEQRLPAGAGAQLGPLAGIYASPQLGSISQRWQVSSHTKPGLLVGWIIVIQQNNEVLPSSYQALHLEWGINCVYLESTGPTTFAAWITTPPYMPTPGGSRPVQEPCRDETGSVPYPLKGPLQVVTTDLPAGFGQADMVPAARFELDNSGNTVFGLPCLAQWCRIGLTGFTPGNHFCSWLPAGVACPTRREAQIASWYDEQPLEERAGGTWQASSIRAAIVPEPMLHTRPIDHYTNSPQLVARVYLSASPPTNTKLWRLGLRAGANEIRLVNHVLTGQMWQFEVTPITVPLNAGEFVRPWKVLGPHRHYDAPLPGTARFRFTITDPGIWAPCGQYCCDSDGIS